RADDEMRHVLRPHVRGQTPDVRDRLPQSGPRLRRSGGDGGAAARGRQQRLPVRRPGGENQGVHDASVRDRRAGRRRGRLHVGGRLMKTGGGDADRSELPLWREEISFRDEEERYVARRQFGRFLVLTSAAMFAGNVWIWLRSRMRRVASVLAVPIARVGEIAV